MSFTMTSAQIKTRTKTVTRRFGWWFLKTGDIVCAVEKVRGLGKGEKVKRLAVLRIISVREEPLLCVTESDCYMEGYPLLSALEFIEMIKKHYKCKDTDIINRIEFEYIDFDI